VRLKPICTYFSFVTLVFGSLDLLTAKRLAVKTVPEMTYVSSVTLNHTILITVHRIHNAMNSNVFYHQWLI